MSAKDAMKMIEALETGEMSDDQVRGVIDLRRQQLTDDRTGKANPSP